MNGDKFMSQITKMTTILLTVGNVYALNTRFSSAISMNLWENCEYFVVFN